MAIQTSLKKVAERLADAIRSFSAGEGWDQDELAIAGTFDDRTDTISLVVGSDRKFDEQRWYVGIMNSIRREFKESPSFASHVSLVLKNVQRPDQVYYEMLVGDHEIDLTELF